MTLENHKIKVEDMEHTPLDLKVIFYNKITPVKDENLLYFYDKELQSRVMRKFISAKPISKLADLSLLDE